MHAERSTTAPLFIPLDILDAHLQEAREQVERSIPATAPRLALTSPGAQAAAQLARELRLVRLAVFSAVGLWAALVAVWSWFAVQTGSAALTTIAVAGALALALTVVALGRWTPARPRAQRARTPEPLGT